MQKIYHDLNLDFNDSRTIETVNVKQYDTGRVIRIHLYNNGNIIFPSEVDGDKAYIFASTNGIATAVSDEVNIVNGEIRINLTPNLTAIAGRSVCDVRITGSHGQTHTSTFNLWVEPSPVQTDMPYIISTADFVERLISIANGTGGIAMASAYTNAISESTEATAEVVQPVDIILYAAARDTATSPTVVNFNVAGGTSPYVGTVDYKRSDSDAWITTAIITEWDGNSKSISVPTIEATAYDIRITITDSQSTQATCYLSI